MRCRFRWLKCYYRAMDSRFREWTGSKTPQGYRYLEGGIQSSDGHCRAFDAAAEGMVSSSGAGVVVLKRLADALADGDRIHAVVKATAVNNDGAVKVGFTAPSEEGQAEVILEALQAAGLEPETIGYVEAHGTATALGDPIEVAALSQVFGKSPARRGTCALGSVKTNIGHADAAAGAAGLIKAALAVEHGRVPPSLHFERPNSAINFAETPFYVPTELREWDSAGAPRRAGVSAFGIGGTNETEKGIAEIWHTLLGIEQVGIHDDFLELGGDSLIGVQLIARLRESFRVQLSMQEVFEAPTVAAMAARIAGHDQREDLSQLDELLREVEEMSLDEVKGELRQRRS
ncbi:MAG: hypothetical protein GY856_01760 [bacterium]|nr:hypothetical protein [bacterium]